jgi:aquaporin Z
MLDTLKKHWPEYLMEGAGLGLFMISACVVTTLLEHPSSPLRQALPDRLARRFLTGLAMAATAVTIVFSPWGKRSGAHINPAITLTFLRLKKIAAADAVFYAAAQFLGALAGVGIAALALGMALSHPAVHYAATLPGEGGPWIAFAAEAVITFVLMSVILAVSNHRRLARFTGLFAAGLVALYITVEAPLSGMSMNPARTLGSAAGAGGWTTLWIYFLAPPLGMLLAAEARTRLSGASSVLCAKLHHANSYRCIFRCGYAAANSPTGRPEIREQAL